MKTCRTSIHSPALSGMSVRVHQAGQDQLALQIQDVSAGPATLQDLLAAPDLHDAAGLDGNRFLDRESLIDGDDLPAVQNQVGLRGVGAPVNSSQQAAHDAQAEKAGWAKSNDPGATLRACFQGDARIRSCARNAHGLGTAWPRKCSKNA